MQRNSLEVELMALWTTSSKKNTQGRENSRWSQSLPKRWQKTTQSCSRLDMWRLVSDNKSRCYCAFPIPIPLSHTFPTCFQTLEEYYYQFREVLFPWLMTSFSTCFLANGVAETYKLRVAVIDFDRRERKTGIMQVALETEIFSWPRLNERPRKVRIYDDKYQWEKIARKDEWVQEHTRHWGIEITLIST